MPQAIKYLLRTYETPTVMREAFESIRSIFRRDEELEESYRKRFKDDINRSGKVYEEDEKMTLYVESLSKIIQTIVARHG